MSNTADDIININEDMRQRVRTAEAILIDYLRIAERHDKQFAKKLAKSVSSRIVSFMDGTLPERWFVADIPGLGYALDSSNHNML